MKITIKITKEILEQSKYCNIEWIPNISKRLKEWETNCAFSLAVREIFPDAWVQEKYIRPFKEEETKALYNKGFLKKDVDLLVTKIPLPKEACKWINDFDLNSEYSRPHMRLIEVTIDVPEKVMAKVIAKIGLDEVYKILSTSKTLKLALV